jgi:hypothetical protein
LWELALCAQRFADCNGEVVGDDIALCCSCAGVTPDVVPCVEPGSIRRVAIVGDEFFKRLELLLAVISSIGWVIFQIRAFPGR